MTYDKKRQQTFRQLECIANDKVSYNPYQGKIYCRYGRFYATNKVILACCEWPELSHCCDDEWRTVKRYNNGDGLHLEIPELAELPVSYRDDLFEKFFRHQYENDCYRQFSFNPKYMRDAMRLFEINRIFPIYSVHQNEFIFTGHKDVSIKVLLLGCAS